MKFSINIIYSLFILIFISACSSGSSGGGSSGDPGIINFSATANTIEPGDSVDLLFEFVGGTGVINNGVGGVTSGTAITVSPTTTTTYNLTVTKADGSASATSFVTITVAVIDLDLLGVLGQNLDQIFQAGQFSYTASVGFLAKSIQVKATAADTGSNITVNGASIGNDGLSPLINLPENTDTEISIIVSQDTISKTYTLTVSRADAATFAQQAYLKASNIGADDEFGYSVALSDDTLAVGAYLEDSDSDAVQNENASGSGAVYIFTRSAGIWSQQAYIKASNISAGDNFGISVALSGDTLAVGAPKEDSDAQGVRTTTDGLTPDSGPDVDSGAVYIFVRSGSSWSQQAHIKASNALVVDNDLFGSSVALFDNTLAVGAINEDSSTTGVETSSNLADETASNSGAVYVFIRDGNNWIEQAYIKASNTGALDTFGQSLALFNNTLAVGAPNEDSNTTGINSTPPVDNSINDNYGAVYVFFRNDTSWSQQAFIKAAETTQAGGGQRDFFGTSVALSDETLAVGMSGDDNENAGINTTPVDSAAGRDSGAVYVYARSGSSWTQQAYIKPSVIRSGDLFGHSVALSGDTLAAGIPNEDSNTTGINSTPNINASLAGAVYTFSRSGTSWSEQHYIKASNTEGGDRFGWSTALSGDTLAVGAHLEASSSALLPGDNTAGNSGAVYTFE